MAETNEAVKTRPSRSAALISQVMSEAQQEYEEAEIPLPPPIVRKKLSKKVQSIMPSLAELEEMSLQRTKEMFDTVTSPEGCVEEKLCKIPPTVQIHDMILPGTDPEQHRIEVGLNHLLQGVKRDYLSFLDQIKTKAFSDNVKRQINEEMERKRMLKNRKSDLESEINKLAKQGVVIFHDGLKKLEIVADTPEEFICKAKEIVSQHTKLARRTKSLEKEIRELEAEQEYLLKQKEAHLLQDLTYSMTEYSPHDLRMLVRREINAVLSYPELKTSSNQSLNNKPRPVGESKNEQPEANSIDKSGQPHSQAGHFHSHSGQPQGQAVHPLSQAGQPHSQAVHPLVQAGQPHSQAGQPHSQAGQPHSQAVQPHSQAVQPHSQAVQPHSQAGQPHSQDSFDEQKQYELSEIKDDIPRDINGTVSRNHQSAQRLCDNKLSEVKAKSSHKESHNPLPFEADYVTMQQMQDFHHREQVHQAAHHQFEVHKGGHQMLDQHKYYRQSEGHGGQHNYQQYHRQQDYTNHQHHHQTHTRHLESHHVNVHHQFSAEQTHHGARKHHEQLPLQQQRQYFRENCPPVSHPGSAYQQCQNLQGEDSRDPMSRMSEIIEGSVRDPDTSKSQRMDPTSQHCPTTETSRGPSKFPRNPGHRYQDSDLLTEENRRQISRHEGHSAHRATPSPKPKGTGRIKEAWITSKSADKFSGDTNPRPASTGSKRSLNTPDFAQDYEPAPKAHRGNTPGMEQRFDGQETEYHGQIHFIDADAIPNIREHAWVGRPQDYPYSDPHNDQMRQQQQQTEPMRHQQREPMPQQQIDAMRHPVKGRPVYSHTKWQEEISSGFDRLVALAGEVDRRSQVGLSREGTIDESGPLSAEDVYSSSAASDGGMHSSAQSSVYSSTILQEESTAVSESSHKREPDISLEVNPNSKAIDEKPTHIDSSQQSGSTDVQEKTMRDERSAEEPVNQTEFMRRSEDECSDQLNTSIEEDGHTGQPKELGPSEQRKSDEFPPVTVGSLVRSPSSGSAEKLANRHFKKKYFGQIRAQQTE